MFKKQIPLAIPIDHPAFAGHFPSVPIVPGVVLLDEVLYVIEQDEALQHSVWKISSVKFLSPLKPGEEVVMQYEQLANGNINFAIWEQARQIVSGSLAPAMQPQS